MKLITETVEDVESIVESNEAGAKTYKIRGVMMESDTQNRNGRIYENRILIKETRRYVIEYVNKNRAMGELNHPSGPTVNLDRVSHMIESLKENGKQIIGEAKIIDTPMGNIVKNLIDAGAKLGVSSRGMGSLEKRNGVNYVKEDFTLAAIDIVADPSAPNAFVDGILEGKEWIWNNGILIESDIAHYEKQLKRTSNRKLEETAINLFSDFLRRI
jgi:hypothetical protein|tara:strand:+ start:1093 stop:1737 length:645 start_codon:yes stop_codon:yes gene_type:complete